MYHHYNDLTTRDPQSLGRPASLYSTLYQKPCVTDEQQEQEKSGDAANASRGWHQHNNGWNHNNECNNSKSSPPLTPLPPSSAIINNNSSISNHLSFHPSSSSNKSQQLQHQHDLLPSIVTHKTMSSPSTTTNTTANHHTSTTSPSNNLMSAYNSPTYFVSPSTTSSSTTTSVYPASNTSHHYSSYYGGSGNSNHTSSNTNHSMPYPSRHSLVARPKLTTTLWEDEGTICYQVDANGICVARRQDNDMINGTKLLNVAGMSRGKRDGILKNEKGRVVVKVGAMHLKGVWITFARAKLLAAQYKIQEILYPLFVDDPSVFLYATALHNPMSSSRVNSLNGYSSRLGFNNSSPYTQWDRQLSSIHHEHSPPSYRNVGIYNNSMNGNSDMYMVSSSQQQQQPDGVDYNRPPTYSSLSHSNSSYSLYGQESSNRPRMYFSNELLDDESRQDIKHESLSDPSSPYYGHNNNNKLGTNTLASPTPSEAGKSSSAFHLPPSRTSGEYDSTSSITSGTTTSTSTANERRSSLVMSSSGSRVTSSSPRHHPYMSPGKVYTPSIMSTLQSYRSDYSTAPATATKEDDTHDMNKSW